MRVLDFMSIRQRYRGLGAQPPPFRGRDSAPVCLKQTIMLRWIFFATLVALAAVPARADSPYEGKTVTIITSTGGGGVYDLTARVIARHMGRYIPGNPTLIVQNMPGGGNVLATNYMYAIAPRTA